MQNLTRRLGQTVLALASIGLPLFLLLTSWIPGRWPALAFDTCTLIAVAVLLICWAAHPFESRFDWTTLVPIAAGVIGLFQIRAGTTVNPQATLLSAYDWFGLAALYFLAQQFFALDRRLSRYFPSAALIFSTMYSIYAVVQWFTSQGRIFWLFPNASGLDRVMGTLLNRNHYAAYIELFLPAVFWYFVQSPTRNPHAAVATAVLFASIVASYSRAGFAVAVVELVAIFLLRRYWESSKDPSGASSGWLIAAALAAVVVFAFAIGLEPLEKRLTGRTLTSVAADYEQSRWEYLEASVQMWKARPVLGFGLGTWPELYPAYGSYDSPDAHVNHAHNDPAEWLAEGGLIFLLPIAVLAALVIRTGFVQPWALGGAGVLLHSLVDFPLQKMAIFSALLLILAGGRDRARRVDT